MKNRNSAVSKGSDARGGRKTLSKRIPRIGKVLFGDEANPIHCTVRDFSPSGATIIMTGWLGLPTDFSLYVEPDCVRAHCKVVERKGNCIRVVFEELEDDIRLRMGPRSSQQSMFAD